MCRIIDLGPAPREIGLLVVKSADLSGNDCRNDVSIADRPDRNHYRALLMVFSREIMVSYNYFNWSKLHLFRYFIFIFSPSVHSFNHSTSTHVKKK